MAKVTDRYENENLIKLAKKQYTDKKISKLPSEIVNIPSNGLIYSIDSPLREGHVELRHMTAYDEDILTNMSYITEGIVLEKLLESLIVSDINVSEIANFDKEALIIAARISAYGEDYPITIIDPNTKNEIKTSINLSNLQYKTLDLETDDIGECTYICENKTVIKFSYAPNQVSNNPDKIISSFLKSVITQINDSRDPNYIDEFLQYQFPFQESKKFQKYVSTHMPGMIKEVEIEGESGGTFTAGFQIGSNLFWPDA